MQLVDVGNQLAVEEHNYSHRRHLDIWKQHTSQHPSQTCLHVSSPPSAFIHAWVLQRLIYMLPKTTAQRRRTFQQRSRLPEKSPTNTRSSSVQAKHLLLRMPESQQQAVNRCPFHCPRPTPNIPPGSQFIINAEIMIFSSFVSSEL